jgi:hypothetical protein
MNGERIDNSPSRIIELKDKSIIHVVQLERTQIEELNIYFKFADQKNEVLKVKTTPKTQIRSVF